MLFFREVIAGILILRVKFNAGYQVFTQKRFLT